MSGAGGRRHRLRACHRGSSRRAGNVLHHHPQHRQSGTAREGGPFLRRGRSRQFLNRLNGALIPIPVLAEAATGLGYLNWLPDDDRVVRRVPLILNINGQVEPSLSMEALRVAQGASAYVIKSTNTFGETSGKSARVEAVEVGDVIVPLQADGELRVWFAKSDQRRSIPAWKALDERGPLGSFRQDRLRRHERLVAVGYRRDAAQSVDAGR